MDYKELIQSYKNDNLHIMRRVLYTVIAFFIIGILYSVFLSIKFPNYFTLSFSPYGYTATLYIIETAIFIFLIYKIKKAKVTDSYNEEITKYLKFCTLYFIIPFLMRPLILFSPEFIAKNISSINIIYEIINISIYIIFNIIMIVYEYNIIKIINYYNSIELKSKDYLSIDADVNIKGQKKYALAGILLGIIMIILYIGVYLIYIVRLKDHQFYM